MKYKAFISYSHAADGQLAPALQSALQHFARPWYKRLQLHTLRVFRDQTNLALSPHLWSSIEQAMNESEYFILLASPQAAQSKWVQKEVAHWLKNRPHTTLLIVLTDGTIEWDSTQGDYDWTKTTALPPLLSKVFPEEPLYLDFRGIHTQTDLSLRNPTFLDGVARISAPLQGRSLDELIGENVRQHRNSKILAWTIGTVFFVLFVIAFWQFLVARQQRDIAGERLATFYWSQAVTADSDRLKASHYSAKLIEALGPILTESTLIARIGLRKQKVSELRSQIQAAFLNIHTNTYEIYLDQVLHHDGAIRGAAFSQDEQRILTWSDDGTARLWRTQNGTPIGQPLHNERFADPLITPDGERILTWGSKTVQLWRAQDGLPIGQPLHNEGFADPLITPDGQRILTYSADGTAQLWRAQDGMPIGHRVRFKDEVWGVFASPDGQRFLTWGEDDDGTARLWQVQDNQDNLSLIIPSEDIQTQGWIHNAFISPDRQWILTWGDGKRTRLWRAKDGTPIGHSFRHKYQVRDALLTKDEQYLLTWSQDETAQLWRVQDGTPLGEPLHFGDEASGTLVTSDGQRLLTWSKDGTAQLQQTQDGTPLGKPLLFGDEGMRVFSWRERDSAQLSQARGERGTAQLQQAQDGTPLGEFLRRGDGVEERLVTKDGQRILTWSRNGTAELWRAQDGTMIGEPMRHEDHIQGALVTQDEQQIITLEGGETGYHGTVRIWRAQDGTPIGQPLRPGGGVGGVLSTKDGERILTWSKDSTAQLWRVDDGTPIGQPMRHEGEVNGALLTEDEQYILTWSAGGVARLWRAQDGTPIGPSLRHEDAIKGAFVTKDGQSILTWTDKGTPRLWSIDPDYDFPADQILLMVEVLTGTIIDDFGNIRALSVQEWSEKKKRYLEIAEDHLQECTFQSANVYKVQKQLWGIK